MDIKDIKVKIHLIPTNLYHLGEIELLMHLLNLSLHLLTNHCIRTLFNLQIHLL